jgi:DegV family protein with EDD domain
VAVVVSSRLSGTYASAEAAARQIDPPRRRITVVDSRSASLGEGLLAVRGAELAAAGWAPPAIVRELTRVRDRSGGFFTVDTLDRLLRSGRVSRVQAWLGSKLNLKPIMAITVEGTIDPVARSRGRAAARRRLLQHLDAALADRPRDLRLGIVHADLPAFADDLAVELVARYHPRQCVTGPITPVIAAHAGIGAWGVFYQVDGGTNP